MRKYSDEQLARAKGTDIAGYLEKNGYETVKVGEDVVRLTEQDVYVRGSMWCWFSHYMMGDAISFLVKYEGRTFREAMDRLISEKPQGDFVRESQDQIILRQKQNENEGDDEQ